MADQDCPPCPPPQPIGLPARPSETPADALAAAGSFDLGGEYSNVDVGRVEGAGAASLGGRIMILGYSNAVTFRATAAGAFGGGSAGFLSRYVGDVSIGPALTLASSHRLVARVGLEAASRKDDTLDASVYTVPAGFVGYQFSTNGAMFEIGPRGGLTVRAQYDPGNESKGLRFHRRPGVRPSWGGAATLVSNPALFNFGLTRVEDADAPLWFADGNGCVTVTGKEPALIVCAMGQYWQSVVVGSAGQMREVPSWILGGSLGLSFFDIKRHPSDG